MSAKDRDLPHDDDAELAVLGAAVLEAGVMAALLDAGLGAEDFYRAAHAAVYRAMRALYESGRVHADGVCDPVLVRAELRAQGAEEVAEREELFFRLGEQVPSVDNAVHYAGIVMSLAKRRAAIEARGREIGDLYDLGKPFEAGDAWPELTPLREATGEPPTFPVEALPAWLGSMVAGVATATQTPPELAGSVGLAVLALAAGGKVEVEPWPDWREPVCLFLAVALPPGCRKSAVFRHMTGPLTAWEKGARERSAPEIAQAETEREIDERRLRKLKESAAEGDTEAEQEAVRLSEESAGKRLPVYPRLFTCDATPEAIARLLAEQDGRLGVFSAEGGELTAIAAGRYSKDGRANLEILLKSHAGDALRVDRANRERAPIILDHPALTLALCVQPSVLQAAWEHDEFASRGLLARFLFALPPNPLGTRDVTPPPVAETVRQDYEASVLALLDLTPTCDEQDRPEALTLTPEAADMLREFMRELEPDLGPGGRHEHMSGFFGKLAGAVARIAGLLHLGGVPHDHRSRRREPIDGNTMEAALALGRFYGEHAERCAKSFGGTPEARLAVRVLDGIGRHGWRRFSEREAYRELGVRQAEFAKALALLAETGHVRRAADVGGGRPDDGGGRRGRKASPEWEVNPALARDSVKSVNSVGGV